MSIELLKALKDELQKDIDRPEGRWGIHGHSEVGDDYFSALEYVVKRITELETLPRTSQPVQASVLDGWKDDWKKQVMEMWKCVRKHDSSIPDDYLDLMRDCLLSAAPTPPSAEQPNPWHEAVLHECMMTEACYVESDPLQSVKNLIAWHIDNTEFHLHNTNQNLLLRISELEQPDSAAPNDYVLQIEHEIFGDNEIKVNFHTNGDFDLENIPDGTKLYWRPQVDPKPQRITEQDARELVMSYYNSSKIFDVWIQGEGAAILAKLNEHREPDYKASEWRPIETAPKDGTEILLCSAVLHDIGLCYWREDSVLTGWTWGMKQRFNNPKWWMPLPSTEAIAKASADTEGK